LSKVDASLRCSVVVPALLLLFLLDRLLILLGYHIVIVVPVPVADAGHNLQRNTASQQSRKRNFVPRLGHLVLHCVGISFLEHEEANDQQQQPVAEHKEPYLEGDGERECLTHEVGRLNDVSNEARQND